MNQTFYRMDRHFLRIENLRRVGGLPDVLGGGFEEKTTSKRRQTSCVFVCAEVWGERVSACKRERESREREKKDEREREGECNETIVQSSFEEKFFGMNFHDSRFFKRAKKFQTCQTFFPSNWKKSFDVVAWKLFMLLSIFVQIVSSYRFKVSQILKKNQKNCTSASWNSRLLDPYS